MLRRATLLAVPLLLLLAGSSLAATPRIVEYPIPTPESKPVGIAPGPEGAMWFTEANADKIGRVTIEGGVEEVASTAVGYPRGGATGPAWIVRGPGSQMWFTQGNPAGVGRTGLDSPLTEFHLPIEPRKPIGIAAGPDGNIWFADRWGAIWRSTPQGELTEFPVTGPFNYEPNGIAAGPDGALWFTARGFIGRVTTSGQERRYPVPRGSNMRQIVSGPDGNLWFTDERDRGPDGTWGGAIGRMTRFGKVTEFGVPSTEGNPVGIARGPDGNLWFTERRGNAIGRITPAGRITEFPLSRERGYPFGIAAGPDGDLWFTESFGNSIGRIRPRLRGAGIVASTVRVRRGRVRLGVTCSGDLGAGCHGLVRISSSRPLARSRYRMPAESTRTVTLALDRRGRALLRRDPSTELQVTVSVVGGQSGKRTVTLRRG